MTQGATFRPTGEDLIQRCRAGDRAALESVLRAEAPRLERLLVRLVGPNEDVKDLLQTTLMAAVGAFPRFRGEASVRTWLARIAVRIVHEHLRRPEERRARLRLVRSADELEAHSPAPDKAADARRALRRLYEHLAAIPAKQRIAFVLHVVEGRPIDEVAALMSATKTATKSRVFLARRSLVARVRSDEALSDFMSGQQPLSSGEDI